MFCDIFAIVKIFMNFLPVVGVRNSIWCTIRINKFWAE